MKLPCQPNVVTLLENYLKYLARNNFTDNKVTTKKSRRQPEVLDKQQLEKRLVFIVTEFLVYILFSIKIFSRYFNFFDYLQFTIHFFFHSYKICIEVLDGLRICFNTFLFRQLLVNEDEQAQYYEALKCAVQPPVYPTFQYE